MGLNAAVYADDDEEQRLALVRIGNSSLAAFLRKEISELGYAAPVLQEKVLYSSTHAGDVLTPNEVEALETELCSMPRGSAELELFRGELLALCKLAIRHRRPIVF